MFIWGFLFCLGEGRFIVNDRHAIDVIDRCFFNLFGGFIVNGRHVIDIIDRGPFCLADMLLFFFVWGIFIVKVSHVIDVIDRWLLFGLLFCSFSCLGVNDRPVTKAIRNSHVRSLCSRDNCSNPCARVFHVSMIFIFFSIGFSLSRAAASSTSLTDDFFTNQSLPLQGS